MRYYYYFYFRDGDIEVLKDYRVRGGRIYICLNLECGIGFYFLSKGEVKWFVWGFRFVSGWVGIRI